MATAEFALEREWESDRSGPGRWVFSHAARHKLAILGMLVGAVGNAMLAAVQPILIGQAFDAISRPTPEISIVMRAAILVAVTQIVRGVGLRKGEIIEEGSHGSLMARGGHYAELYNTYFRHQSPDYRPPVPEGEDDSYLELLPQYSARV